MRARACFKWECGSCGVTVYDDEMLEVAPKHNCVYSEHKVTEEECHKLRLIKERKDRDAQEKYLAMQDELTALLMADYVFVGICQVLSRVELNFQTIEFLTRRADQIIKKETSLPCVYEDPIKKYFGNVYDAMENFIKLASDMEKSGPVERVFSENEVRY